MDPFIVFQQMLIILILIFVGFLCRRYGKISDENSVFLSKLIVDVLNPAIILSSITYASSGTINEPLLWIMCTAGLIYVYLIVIAFPIARIFAKKNSNQKGETVLYQLMVIFSNIGFIGIPVISSLFGSQYLIYVAVFLLFYNFLFYTYGTYLMKKGNGHTFSLNDLKPLFNMGTIASVLALILFLKKTELPLVLSKSVTYLGNAAVPLSLMVIGVTLGAQEDLKAILLDYKAYLYSLINLILIPLIAAFFLKRFSGYEDLNQISVILLAMPVGSMSLMFAKEYQMDEKICLNNIMISTVLSVVTIPLIVVLYQSL